ncbi:MAG: hypothetical protein M3R48_04415 [Candidatus Dormibacteraeota bacterium]|nr:hypothetical protein [Candidatus Dormibacteraeota bacterium]
MLGNATQPFGHGQCDVAVPYPVRRRVRGRRYGEEMVERFILALRTDFGCLVIIIAFLVIMISTIVFANIITPPSANPFV